MADGVLLRGRLGKDYEAQHNISTIQSIINSGRNLVGTKGNFFGDLTSMDENMSEAIAQSKALGPLNSGYIPLIDGKPQMHKTFYDNHVGKVVTTDGTGTVQVINKDIVDEAVASAVYIENQIDDLIEIVMKNNNICATVLNMSMEDLKGHLEPKKALITVDGLKLDSDIEDVNGMPSSLRISAPGSADYYKKLAKLRAMTGMRIQYVNMTSFGRSKSNAHNPNVRAPQQLKTDGEGKVEMVNNQPIVENVPGGVL